jgi:hypothetical protein
VRQATLPPALYERQIIGMEVGDEGYTVPWAMWADSEGKLWLNLEYSVHKAPHGTVQMLVRKLRFGFEVNTRQVIGYLWNLGERSTWNCNRGPVLELIK